MCLSFPGQDSSLLILYTFKLIDVFMWVSYQYTGVFMYARWSFVVVFIGKSDHELDLF